MAIFVHFWLPFDIDVGCKLVVTNQFCVGIMYHRPFLVSTFAVGVSGGHFDHFETHKCPFCPCSGPFLVSDICCWYFCNL